jgi:hypothetical protein
MSDEARILTWTDGARWSASAATFAHLTARLDALREVIVGLDAVASRWRAASGATRTIDAVAPTEDDRAVLTAALARIVEDGAGELEEEDARRDFEAGAASLHELLVTDVTRS